MCVTSVTHFLIVRRSLKAMILELKNIDKSFGEKEVLKGVSFTAEGGKAFGLLGRNGAGKTTSIRILMNVFPANSGEAVGDFRTSHTETLRRKTY